MSIDPDWGNFNKAAENSGEIFLAGIQKVGSISRRSSKKVSFDVL